MNLPNNIKYAVFDLDGTMFDSMWLWKQIDYDYLSKRGVQVPDDYMKCINHMSIMDTALYSIKRFNLKDTLHMILISQDIIYELLSFFFTLVIWHENLR